MLTYIIFIIVTAIVIFLDQLTKVLIVDGSVDVVIIDKLLKFTPCYNSGAAFSFLAGKSWSQVFFIILTFIVCLALVGWVLHSFVEMKRKGTKQSNWFMVALSMILGGAIGNLIDRLMFHEVRDFVNVFYETEIFPAIFNVADIALVIGTIMLLIYFLFIDKDAIFKGKKKETEDSDGNKDLNK